MEVPAAAVVGIVVCVAAAAVEAVAVVAAGLQPASRVRIIIAAPTVMDTLDKECIIDHLHRTRIDVLTIPVPFLEVVYYRYIHT